MGRISRTEAIARQLLHHYHPRLKQVYNHRPDWLQNPETGHNLEIDIWLPDLQAGIEVQGIQHGRPIVGLQKDFAAFEKQQRHDMLKIERCKDHGVALYHLTIFDLTERSFLPWLKQFEINHRLLPNRYADTPAALFAAAEKLSRARFKPLQEPVTRPKPDGMWRRLWRWVWS